MPTISLCMIVRNEESVIVSLNAGDVIDMAVSALVAVGITLGSGVSATLTVKKISD